jgi:hypothetical protein
VTHPIGYMSAKALTSQVSGLFHKGRFSDISEVLRKDYPTKRIGEPSPIFEVSPVSFNRPVTENMRHRQLRVRETGIMEGSTKFGRGDNGGRDLRHSTDRTTVVSMFGWVGCNRLRKQASSDVTAEQICSSLLYARR